jgi:hypothetical protein
MERVYYVLEYDGTLDIGVKLCDDIKEQYDDTVTILHTTTSLSEARSLLAKELELRGE